MIDRPYHLQWELIDRDPASGIERYRLWGYGRDHGYRGTTRADPTWTRPVVVLVDRRVSPQGIHGQLEDFVYVASVRPTVAEVMVGVYEAAEHAIRRGLRRNAHPLDVEDSARLQPLLDGWDTDRE